MPGSGQKPCSPAAMANFNASWGDAFDSTGDTGNDEQRISNFRAMQDNDFTTDDDLAHSDSDIEISGLGFDNSWGEVAVEGQPSTSCPQQATPAAGSRRRPGRPKGTKGSRTWRAHATLGRCVLYTI